MKVSGYLLVRPDGKDTTFYKNRPPHEARTVCLPVRLEIPDALFEPPVIPTVEIVIDESILPHVAALNEHVEGLQDAGVKVRLVQQ